MVETRDPESIAQRSENRPIWLWLALANGALVIMLATALVAFWLRFQASERERAQAAAQIDRLRETHAADGSGADSTAANTTVAMRPTLPGDEAHDADQPSDNPLRTANEPISRATLIERAMQSVVLITAIDGAGREIATGSGFIIDASGLVATNFHVVERANRANVQFRDRTECRVVGYRAMDEKGDLAILEIEQPPANLRPLALASDDLPSAGAEVLAVGHPSGFQFATSEGVVSAVHTTSELPEGYRSRMKAPPDHVWIQTTAAISGGNSGGPLLDRRGQVIGLNTWIALGENLGFASHVRHLRALQEQSFSSAMPLDEVSKPQAELAALATACNQELAWFESRMEAAETPKEKEELMRVRNPAPKFMARFFEFADNRRKTSAALAALRCICELSSRDDSEACGKWLRRASDRLLEDHLSEPSLPRLVEVVGQSPHASAIEFLRKITDKATTSRAKGLACYWLGYRLAETESPGAERDEALALFERVQRDFRDVAYGGTTLGALAGEYAFVVKNLSLGCAAPEITGSDSAGKEFKLSDFRGKVVLLDFWANWCPHCVRMYPFERELLSKYENRGLAIAGVNVDEKDVLLDVEKEKQVIWRSWSDGSTGPITQEWRVEGYPTLYLLDREGIIRFKRSQAPDEELYREIEKTIEELLGQKVGNSGSM